MKRLVTGVEAFVLLLVGQTISLFGSGLTAFALDVWIFLETRSVTLFGLIAVLAVLPNIIISPIAGALVDRWDRRWVMIITDTAAAASTLVLAYLLATDQLAVLHVAIATVYMSTLAAFQRPAYVATLPLLVPRRYYERTNGIASMVAAVIQIITPAVAALLVIGIGLWGVLILDFITYLIAMALIIIVHVPRPKLTAEGQSSRKGLLSEALHGWIYLRQRAGLFALMIFSTLNNFFVGILVVLMTPLVLTLYSVKELGLVLSVGGSGILVGGLLMSIWRGPRRRIYGILGFHFLGGIAVLLAGLVPIPIVFYLAAFTFFLGIPVIDALATAIWLNKTVPDVLGRTRAVRQAFSWSLLPVSYILSGVLADNFFEPLFAEDGPLVNTVMGNIFGVGPGYGIAFLFALAGLFSMLLAVAGLVYPRLRRIEEELPDVVSETPEMMAEPSTVNIERPPEKIRFGMTHTFRVVIALVVATLSALTLAAVFIVLLTIRGPFPQAEGTVAVAGVQQQVDIYRDKYGVPHIYAASQEDMLFAQGYVHAQDRFWQMEMQRRVAQGRISEVVGEFGIDLDLMVRNIGWNRIAAQTWTMYQESEPEVVAALEAYSAGVNAYLSEHKDQISLNMTIFGIIADPWEIEPWRPVDTLAIGVLLDWNLAGGMYREQERAILSQHLGETAAAELWPYYSVDRPYILQGAGGVNSRPHRPEAFPDIDWQSLHTSFIGAFRDPRLGVGQHPFAGSNSWVVSGQLTDTGLPLLANDPHLALEIPSRWYQVGLHAPQWDVAGFSFAGIPGVIVGRNEHIAWGLTNARLDTQDLFIEKVNPDNPLQYEYEGEWHDMEVITEVIKVPRMEDVVLQVRRTHHGSIVIDADERLNDYVFALSWTGYEPSRVFKALLLLNKARNYDDFQDAMRVWDTLSQNVVYADVAGNIAYQLPGRVPIRKNGDGWLPVTGWSGEYEWEGWAPFEELPALLNPETDFIVTANNAIVDENHQFTLSREWGAGDRAARIEEMLQEALTQNGRITAVDFARIQLDTKSLLAADYVPLLLNLATDDKRLQAAMNHLHDWDYQAQKESVGATIFEIFYMHLARAVLADELGDIQDVYLFDGNTQRIFFHNLAYQPDAPWWNNVNTPEVETRDEILLQALTATVNWLERKLGKNMNNWSWGQLHTITLENVPLGRFGIASIDVILNRGPFPVDGSNSVVNAIDWEWDEPARSTGGVTFRMIIDLSGPDSGQAIHATGQSGHPYHPHYDDFIEMWLNGEYHPMLLSSEGVQGNMASHLTLIPR